MDWTATDLLYHALYALLVFGIGYVVAGWLAGLASFALGRSALDPIIRRLIVSVIRPVVLALAFFAGLSVIGIDVTAFAAVAGAVTLAIGMAMQGSVSNVASGAMLLSLRPFNADDFITAGGHSGKVKALKLFCTILETPEGNTVTIPNDVVFKGAITTFTDIPNSRVDLTWVVKPDTNLEHVEKKVSEILNADERTLKDPAPSVIFGDATDLGIPVTGRFWATNADKWGAKSDIQQAVVKAFQSSKPKIQIATRAA